MMRAMKPPYRADQVGSLLRPAELAQARRQWKQGQLDAARLKEIEDRAIREVVKKQEQIGLQARSPGGVGRGKGQDDGRHELNSGHFMTENQVQYKTWMCLICGYVYDEEKGIPDEGIAPGTRWEDVPMNWTCPECGARKEDFEMVEI